MIDLTLVATRRPDLLAATLASFHKNLFAFVPVRRVFLNIDPLWGCESDDDEVERACRDVFADVVVRRPTAPGFGAAVKWLWTQPQTEWFLHLEDDWLLNQPVSQWRLDRATDDPHLFQVRFSYWPRLKRLSRRAEFTTSPAFVRAEDARRVAALMNPGLDPEKQMLNGSNPALTAFLKNVRTRYYGNIFTQPMVTDIGREWRDAKGIKKRLVAGASVWTEPDKVS